MIKHVGFNGFLYALYVYLNAKEETLWNSKCNFPFLLIINLGEDHGQHLVHSTGIVIGYVKWRVMVVVDTKLV